MKPGGPAGAPFRAQEGAEFGPVMRVRVFGSSIRVMGRGAEEVEVYTVHCFGPELVSCFGIA